jgi:hypothetical protein
MLCNLVHILCGIVPSHELEGGRVCCVRENVFRQNINQAEEQG